eukprot:COSAG05_NODE_235_length_13191_cov_7.667354_5_plen_42_part_00
MGSVGSETTRMPRLVALAGLVSQAAVLAHLVEIAAGQRGVT